MSRIVAAATALTLTLVLGASAARAHCQVPCGIYDDHNRVHQLKEHARTIRKAVVQIRALAKKRTKGAQQHNQLVRWINTKEQHAELVIRTISDYFMAQKINAKDPKYAEKLKRHHAVMVAAMKCKQKADPRVVDALDKAIAGIAGYWPIK